MRVTYRANRMAVNARGAVSEVPSVLSSLLVVGKGIGHWKGLGTLRSPEAFPLYHGVVYAAFESPVARRRPMKVFGTHDPATLAQLEDVRSRAKDAALMADGHVGYVMPIGGVAAYRDQVSVVGVGFDIACGNAAIRTT